MPAAASAGSASILLVEDDATHAMLMRERLRALPVEIEVAATCSSALGALGRRPYDLVLLDAYLPDGNGFELHHSIREAAPEARIVFVTSDDLAENAVAALRAGAFDYVVKRPNYLEALADAVSGALRLPEVPEAAAHACDGLLGDSPAMLEVRAQIHRFGPTEVPVLVIGETGTGKELVARALHSASPRATGPFVAVNCAAITPSLFESELFGSRRGAYTGAVADRSGLVGEARRGTLFLDEVGELPLGLQAKLLRLLEEGTYRPVGASRESAADVRLLAATNRDLRRQVEAGELRADLYYRLNVLRVALPPLRERRGDIAMLAEHFVAELARGPGRPVISPEARAQLEEAHWPGNVRELRHTIERTLVQTPGARIDRFELDETEPVGPPLAPARSLTRSTLSALLDHHRGRLEPVARDLGVSVRTVQRRMKVFGLERRDFRSSS